MEYVSDAYKEAMKANVRGKSYVEVSLDMTNTYAQESAYISSTFTGVESGLYDDSVAINTVTSSENDGSITFTFGQYTKLLLSGVRFILNETVGSVTATNGTQSKTVSVTDDEVIIEQEFKNCHYIKLTPNSGALSLKKVYFGIVMNFGHDVIMNTSRRNQIKHLNEELPLKEFSFTLHNYDRLWNKDNPDSYSKYLCEKQKIRYTYKRTLLDDSIYDIEGGVVYLKEFSSDDYKASFSGVGKLDYIQDEYKKGTIYSDGITLYQLAEMVLLDAGIVNYELDACLRTFKVTNPLPIDTHKACLQLIAHAGRCVLFEDRNGAVCLKSVDRPVIYKQGYVINATGFSSGDDVINPTTVANYGSTEPSYTYADGLHYFYPESQATDTLPVGFVSEDYADSNGTFTNTPKIEIRFTSPCKLTELVMNCAVAPKDFTIRCYKGSTQVAIRSITDNTSPQIEETFTNLVCDKFEITFTKTTPGQRIHVNSVEPVAAVDYEITYKEMTSNPVAMEIEKVSQLECELYQYTDPRVAAASGTAIGSVNVNYTTLDSGGLAADISTGTGALSYVHVLAGVNVIDIAGPAEIDSVVYADDIEGGTCEIIEKCAYYVKVNCSREGDVSIIGTEFIGNVVDYIIPVNEIGNAVKVSNPLISTEEHYNRLKDWFLDYYENDIEYRFNYRGDPILDADDQIFIENKFVINNLVRIESEELSTSAGMDSSNQIVARRLRYSEASKTVLRDFVLSNEIIYLYGDQTCQLSVLEWIPETATGKTVTWTSSDTSIGTVDANGLVTVIGEGETTITATSANGIVHTCRLICTAPIIAVTDFELSASTISLGVGNTQQLTVVSWTPANASHKTVSFTTSDSTVATVDGDGHVTAMAEGSATITATCPDGISKTCEVTAVSVPATDFTLSASSSSLDTGETLQLSVTSWTPANTTHKTVTWSSSDTSKATVSSNGLVTAVSSGSVTITATCYDGISKTCAVEVTSYIPVTDFVLSSNSLDVTNYEAAPISIVEWIPANATDKRYSATVDDETIAQPWNNGILGVSPGNTTARITCHDGIEKTCHITSYDRTTVSGKPYYYGTRTINGVTFTVNSASPSINMSGTATNDAAFRVKNNITLSAGKYYLYGITNLASYYIEVYGTYNGNSFHIHSYDPYDDRILQFTSSATNVNINLVAKSGKTLNESCDVSYNGLFILTM